MNKIFKTKYDITTGQCKAVSELASNRQIASSSKSKPKCGVFLGNFLGIFKFSPLVLLMSGMLGVSSVSYADITYIDMDGNTGAAGVRENWKEADYWKHKGRENTLLTQVQNSPRKYNKDVNTNVYKSVIIGPHSAGVNTNLDQSTGVGMTILGHGAVGFASQTTAIGNNVYSGGQQATALGSDVMAAGYASIAIGNDDIANTYRDKLPEKTIMKIYGYDTNTRYSGTTYKNILNEQNFKMKYGINNGVDNRIYSPTYAAGVASIAIGSRSVAYGNASLAIGTLSFALANDSTAVGVRAFVNDDATGGVAIGDESRVFAANSFAIGNETEATNQGALTFGSGSKAVGIGSIAIGSNVASNALIASNGYETFQNSIMQHTQNSSPIVEVDRHNEYNTLFKIDENNLKYGDENHIVKLGFNASNPSNSKNPISEIIEKVIGDKKRIAFSHERDEVIETTSKIYKTTKEGDHSISLGYHLSNNGDNTITIGSASVVRGANSVVLGALNNIGKYARNTIALGIGTNVYKENSVAIGTGINVIGAGAVAIGSGVGVTKDNTISIGYGSHGLSSESIILGNSASLKDHSKKSILIGNSAKVENQSQNKNVKIANLKKGKFGLEAEKVELEMSAISIGTESYVYSEKGIALGDNAKIEANSENAIAFGTNSKASKKSAIALGNETEATMENSVALGYKSHTKYFYQDANKNTATLTGKEAIDLTPYVPEGSSYSLRTDKSAGIISVGWTKGNSGSQELGLRRIVGVAPGALDSDVATIGQLKALEYVKREGLVVYYTEDNGKIYKLVKGTDGKFYKVNTKNGTPLDKQEIPKEKVLVGAKGHNEKIQYIDADKQIADIGEKIRFGHLKDGEIKSDSDQAITGNQLKNVGDILGVSVNTPNNTQFDSYKFTAVDYKGSQKKQKTIFKDAIEELITAVNKGIVIQDADSHTGTLNLGSTLTIKAGNIDKPKSDVDGFSSDNIKTSYQPTRKELLIGIKDKPIFKEVTISGTVNDRSDKKTLTTKEYVDGKLANVATSFTVNGNMGNYIVQSALNIKGKADASQHKNITTEAKTNEKELEISLNKDLKDIASITGEGIKSGKNTVYSKIAFNSTNGSNATTNVTISSNGANYTFDRTGFDMSDRRITRLQSGLNTQHHGPKGANGNPENVSKILDGSYITTIKGNAVNVSDLSNVAKAIVEKGLKFAGNSGSEITRKLGEKLTIKGNGTDLTSKTDSKKGEITFTLHKATSIDDNTATNSNKDKVVTAGAVKTYLDSKIDGISTTLGLEADNSKNSGPTGKVNLKNEKLKVAGTSDEIETKVEQDKQSITLSFAQNTKNKLGMITVDGDKLALGKNAKTVDKMTAPKEAKVTVGSDNLKFNWTGGVSADDKEQSKKSVISVGDTGKEHLITHVAAGKVEVNSTDAINGSQLYGVVDAFSKLAINVLGAEADLTSGFKKSSFDVVKYNGNTNTQTSKEMTFKDAIGQNTTAINKGFIFGVGDSNNEQGTHYLGDKLIIKAGAVDKPTSTSDDGYSPDNIKTAYLAKSKELLIGIKDKPTFKEVKVSGTVDDSSDGKTLTTKTYVDGKLANVAANFDVKGDNNVVYTLNKQNNVLNINGDTKNITTAVDKNAKKVSITLKEALTGITSIGKDTNNQIAFSDSGTILKAGGSSLNLTGSSGKVKISNVANGTSDNDAINKSQLNSVVSALGGEAKIGADGNVTAPSYTLANGNKAPYTTVGEALSALDEVLTSVNGAGITFSDGTTNNDFVRKNSENDKKVVIKSGSNINVSLSKTNSDKTGEFTVALNKDLEDINSITLKDNNSSGHSATNKTGKITVDGATGDVKVQHGDGGASKIVIESGLKALTGNDEIQVTGGGKVFGNASLSLKDASIAGTKLKDNTIAEAKLDQGIKDKLNKTFMVKAGGTTSDNLIGNTLEFAAKDSNLTVELDKFNKKISYGLSSTLTGIEYIAKDKTKISLADTKIKLMPEEGAALTLTKSDTDKVKISGLGDGQIDGASNEAITGKQLHDLAGKLGVSVSATSKTGFDEPKFAKINYHDQKNQGKTTFKGAIDDLIVAVNKGLIVGDGTATDTLQLGDTLHIKAGNIDKKSTSDDGFSSDNIKTSYQPNTKELLIGIKDKPSFKQVTVTEEINEKSPETALTTKKYVDSKATQNEQAIANQEIKYKANGAGDNKVKLSEGLDFKNDDNITVTAEAGGAITHKLNADLKNITSIAGKGDRGTTPKIDFANSDGLKISSKGTDLTLKADGLDLNNKQITGIASGLDQKMNGASGRQDLDELLKLVATGQPQNGGTSNDGKLNKAINAGDLLHIANELKNKGLSFQGNDGKDVTRKLGETLKIVGETSATTPTDSTQPAMETAPDNITVAKKTGNGDDTLEIKLSKNLKGIGSVVNGENAKIALGGVNGSDKTITFTSGDKPETVTLKGSTLSGVSEINKEEGKGALKLTENTATLESAKDNSKVELKDKEVTLESAKDGSKVELKDKAVTLESAKDNSKVELKDKAVTLESAKDNSKLELKDKAVTLESTKDGSSVALDGTSATLSAGKDKGSIKVSNGTENKIELSPENGSTVMLKKDMTNSGVQATGLSTIGKDDDNALVFKNSTSGTDKTAELKVGGSALTFTKATTGNTVKISNVEDGKIDTSSTEAITGKQLHDLASKLGVEVESETGFKQPSFTAIKGGTSSTGGTTNSNTGPTTFKDAINQLITAVNGGLTFKGNDGTNSSTKLQLGGTLTIDSSTSNVGNSTNGATSKTEKDITVTLAPSNGNDPQNASTLTLTLNKATSVSETDEKVVTSKAVAEELKKYTTTTDLSKGYLKVDGSNIGDNKSKFGNNVGIAEIKLSDPDKSDKELVQAGAVIKYLKGKGTNSVKISDSPETKAEGDNSISIGNEAFAENADSIAIGYYTSARNRKSLVIGSESTVLGEKSVSIGSENVVDGNHSVVLGEENSVKGQYSYSLGAYNTIAGEHTYALGSNITTTKDITNAVILGNNSQGVSNAVSVGGPGYKKQRRIVYVATPEHEFDAVNKKYVDDLTLSYKSNSTNKQTVKLTDGLDFNKSDNISVSVEADGKITHTLNNNLQEITSIKGGKDEQGAKITLEKDKKEISLNESKLKDLADGEIGDSSKEAVTGKQLADLAKQLGIAVDDTKTTFKAPTFDDFKLKGINGKTTEPAPQNIVEGLKNAVSKLNEGLKFSADMPSAVANGTQNTPHYLGSTINIVRLASNTAGATSTPAPAGTSSQPNIAEFKGDNLITQYTREANGNAKIEIGFKDAPTFSKVMLAEEQTYNGVNGNSGSTDWKKELITKGYLEQALDKFKFKVENGSGKPIEIGRNDTLKFTSGQNIKVDLAKNGTTPSSTGSTSPSASAPAPTPAAPAPVSAAAPSSSSGGAGSNGGGSNSMASSGGSNGAGMATTTPTSAPTTTPTTTTPTTTAVVTIGTTEELKNITSISSKPKAGSAGGSGTGSSAVGNQDEVTKLTLDAEKGATFQVGNQGTEVNINKDGISLTPQSKDGKATLNKDGLTVGDKEAANGDKTHTVYGKDGLTVKGKDGSKEVVSLKVADGENSQGNNGGNGQSATLAFAKIGNGSGAGTGADAKGTGTGKITGLADIKPEETDGTLATNKNYVDGKVSDLNNNRPFDFYLNGEKVVKDKDGNFKKLKDGKPDQLLTEEEKKQVVIKAEPSTAPIGISNVASGLDIDAEKVKQAEKEVKAKRSEAERKATMLKAKAALVEQKEAEITALTQEIENLSGDEKTQKEAELKAIEAELSQFNDELATATKDLKTANDALKIANNTLTKLTEDKIGNLVKGENINPTNGANIGDLQAVARAGLNFEGNDGVPVHKNLGEKLTITGEGTFNSNLTAAGNIKVEMAQDGKGLEVKLSDQLKNMTSFETREINGKKSVLNNGGLNVMGSGDHAGQSASYTLDGVAITGKNGSVQLNTTALSFAVTQDPSGRPVGTGVIRGLKDLDAHATGDMAVNKNYVDARNHELRTQMNNNDRNMRAGVAQAVAQANLPINILPGKSTLSLATGNYMGSQAFAVGYSRVSDNGKLSVKFSLGHGDKKTSVGAGVGYSW